MASSPWIFDLTADTFQTEVLDRSRTTPVVIDFWAPWCGPCRQLTPLLDRMVEEYKGQFYLAKLNTEEQPELAQAFGVQSIPWVVSFKEGQPFDQFMGLVSEAELRAWLDRLVPSKAQQLLKEATGLAESDPRAAEGKLRSALELEPELWPAHIELARLLLQGGRLDESRAIIDRMNARGYLEPEAQRVLSELDVRSAAAESGGVEAARKAAEADPGNLGLKVQLADALAASQQFGKALDLCLEVVAADRDGAGQQAKATMVKIFDMLGPGSELTGTYRRKLTTLLY